MHDDDDKPSSMGPRARRCRGYCEGWRDPDTFGGLGGFHFQINTAEAIGGGETRVHGYWCAGGFDSSEPLVITSGDGRPRAVTVVAFDPPPLPGSERKPHLRSLRVRAADGVVAPAQCIRPAAE